MTSENVSRASFLLRVWRESSDAEADWRASIEDPMTGERQGFANLDAFIQFLRTLTETRNPAEEKHEQNPGG